MDKKEYMIKTDFIIKYSKDDKKIELAKKILEKLQFTEVDIQKLPISIQEQEFGQPFLNQLEWINEEYKMMTSITKQDKKNDIFKRFVQLFKRK